MKEKLNVIHIMLLIYMAEKNVTFFSLPRKVAENIGTNGWLVFILLSGLAIANIGLFWLVYRLGGGASVFDILESALPKYFLYPIYAALAFFWIIAASFIGKSFFFGYEMMVFPTTNPNYLFLIFCFMLYLLLIKPVYNVGKANTVFFLMTFWTVLLNLFHLREWEAVRLTTYFLQDTPQQHSFLGYWEIYTSFVGFEFCLFLFPHVNKQSKLFRGVILGHCMISLSLLSLVLISFGFFSFKQLLSYAYPVVNLLDHIEFTFFNRIENMVLALFMLASLMVTYMFCFAALTTLKQAVPNIKRGRIEFVIVMAVFVIGLYPKSITQVDALRGTVLYVESGLGVVIPISLIAVLLLQKLRRTGLEARVQK